MVTLVHSNSPQSTTVMRLFPFGSFLAILVSFAGLGFLLALGYFGTTGSGGIFDLDAPGEIWYGCPEFATGLSLISFIYANKFRSILSDDSAFFVG